MCLWTVEKEQLETDTEGAATKAHRHTTKSARDCKTSSNTLHHSPCTWGIVSLTVRPPPPKKMLYIVQDVLIMPTVIILIVK